MLRGITATRPLGEAQHLEDGARVAELKMTHGDVPRCRLDGWLKPDASRFYNSAEDTPPLQWWIEKEYEEWQAAGLGVKPPAQREEAAAHVHAEWDRRQEAQRNAFASFDELTANAAAEDKPQQQMRDDLRRR
jgi:hypothetical protein